MKIRTSLLSLLALPVLQASAIDLTPRWIDTAIDGVPKRQLYFADGTKKFMLSIDTETEVNARAGGAGFRFPKFPDIEFLMMPSRFTANDAFDETRLPEYREAALKLLPARGHKSEITAEKVNPIPINGWKSFRAVIRFTMDSRICVQEVTFLNINERDQIVIVTAAPERDWNEADQRSWQITRSWQEMLPGDAGPPKGN